MNFDKIPEERLFQNNTKNEVMHWCRNLQYFHYMRARGGHNCEGDSFCAYFKYNELDDLTAKLSDLGITLNKLPEDAITFDPFGSYTIDDLDKLKIPIPRFNDYEQPQYVEISGNKVHVWVMDKSFEVSVSGAKDGKTYKVSDDDFEVCLVLEKLFDKLEWKPILDEEIKNHPHCISRDMYPELF